eukprot:jgi/Mesvir1/18468/Mv14319-RA.1
MAMKGSIGCDIGSLSHDALVHVLDFLQDGRDLGACASVCRAWRHAACTELLWEKKLAALENALRGKETVAAPPAPAQQPPAEKCVSTGKPEPSDSALKSLLDEEMSSLDDADSRARYIRKDTRGSWLYGRPRLRVLRGDPCGPVHCCRCHGSSLLTGAEDGSIRIWDLNSSSNASITADVNVHGAGRNLNAYRASSSSTNGYGASSYLFHAPNKSAVRDASIDDAKILAAAGNSVYLWTRADRKLMRVFRGHSALVRCLRSDDTHILSGSSDGTARLFDAFSGAPLLVMRSPVTPSGAVHSVEIDADAGVVFCGGPSGGVDVRDTSTGGVVASLASHSSVAAVGSLKLGLHGRALLQASANGTITLWDLRMMKSLWATRVHTAAVTSLDWSPDVPDVFLSAGSTVPGSSTGGGPPPSLALGPSPMLSLSASHSLVVTAHADSSVVLWKVSLRNLLEGGQATS